MNKLPHLTITGLPHSIELEEAILGCCLVSWKGAETWATIAKPGDFYLRGNQAVARAIVALLDATPPVIPDLFSVAETLKAAGEFDEIGGMPRLNHLTDYAGLAANMPWDCGKLLEYTRQRRLIEAYHEGHAIVNDPTLTAGERTAKLLDRLSQLELQTRARLTTSSSEVSAELMRLLSGDDPDPVISTGLPTLDGLLGGGLHPGRLILIGAAAGTGKSVLAGNIVLHAARNHHPALVFSLEMPALQLGRRFIAAETGLDSRTLRHGLNEFDLETAFSAAGRIGDYPIFYVDRPIGLTDLRSICRVEQKVHRIEVILVDYLQLVQPEGKLDVSHYTAIAQGLKSIALELSVPVIGISSLSRATDPKGQPVKPTMSRLRESAGLEHAADTVLLLHAEKQEESAPYPVELIVGKQRDGPSGFSRYLTLNPTANLFSDPEAPEEPKW